MKDKFIDILTFNKLSNLILSANKRIIFSSANLHTPISRALAEAAKKGTKIILIIDPSEQNYRNGLGDIASIVELQKEGIDIYEVIGNQISFIIADEVGYIFFPQSQILEEEPNGPNALLMDDILKLKIIAHYFPPKSVQEKSQLIDSVINLNEQSKQEFTNIIETIQNNITDIKLNPLDQNKLIVVKANLKNNPPLQPDIKRKIETYTTKVQFVELKFIGSNFHTTKISIPKDALPFKDAELRNSLETKLSLFLNIEDNEDAIKFNEIKKKVDDLRYNPKAESNANAFLIPITCRNKSIIKVAQKKAFTDKIIEIRQEIIAFKKGTLEKLESEILDRKATIKKELLAFFKENPPKDYEQFTNDFLFRKIDDLAQVLVSKIKFPDLHTLLSGIELQHNFYDLTIEDFTDEKLIDEFRNKGILKSDELADIVSIQKAFKVAK